MTISKSQAMTIRRVIGANPTQIVFFPDASSGHQDPGTYLTWSEIDSFSHARAALYAFMLGQGNQDAAYPPGSPTYGIASKVVSGTTYYGVSRAVGGVTTYLVRTVTDDGYTWGFGTLANAYGWTDINEAYKAFAFIAAGARDSNTAVSYALHQADNGDFHTIHALSQSGLLPPYRVVSISGTGTSTIVNWAQHTLTGPIFHDLVMMLITEIASIIGLHGITPTYLLDTFNDGYNNYTVLKRSGWPVGATYTLCLARPYVSAPSGPGNAGFLTWNLIWADPTSTPALQPVLFPLVTGSDNDAAFLILQFANDAINNNSSNPTVTPHPMAGAVL